MPRYRQVAAFLLLTLTCLTLSAQTGEAADEVSARIAGLTSHGIDSVGDAYFDRSAHRFRQQDTDGAIADLQAAAEAYRRAKEDAKHAAALCQMAEYYKYRGKQGDAGRAAECYRRAFPLVEKGTPEYLSAATSVMNAHIGQGQHKKASKLARQLQKSGRKVAVRNPVAYADFLLSASVAEANGRQYEQALDYARQAADIYEAAGCTATHNYAVLLKNIADCHFHLQHFQDALMLYEEAKPLLLQTEGAEGKVYQGCLLQIGATNARTGGKEEVVQDFLQELRKQVVSAGDTTTRNYANSLFELAKGMARAGNYREAAAWGERSLRCYEARGDSLRQALVLYTLSGYYTNLGQTARADSLNALSIALSHRQSLGQTEADAWGQKALALYREGAYAEADSISREALAMLRQANLATSTTYAGILAGRALCQNRLGAPQEAIRLTREALELQSAILGPEHGDNAMLLFNLALYHHRLGQMDSVAHYYRRAITQQTRQVRNNFSFQSTRQRELFWQKKSYLYQAAPLFATTPGEAPPQLLTDIYNAQLFTKGILLNSEIDFRRLLQQSADATVLAQYDELQALRAELQQCYEATGGEGRERIPALQHRIGELEYAIVRQCKAYGDFTQNLSLTVDSIRRALLPGEVAVEFLEADITYGGQPDRLYMALLLRPEWEAPHACRLFFRSEIEELGYPAATPVGELLAEAEWQNRIYSDSRLGRLVWGELLRQAGDASHIYFAPTGIFYQWGIEYLPIADDGRRVSETLAVSRLSSTKLLAQRTAQASPGAEGKAVIYGGLEYEDMTISQMREYHDMGDDEADDDEDYTLMLAAEGHEADLPPVSDMAERGVTAKNLKGAKEEAEAIERLLYDAGVAYSIREGFSGTEESFKRLSGRNVTLLHIATHGFSYPVGKSEGSEWLKSSAPAEAMPDDPLRYSGLLFSGCNNKLQNPADFPTDIDDGILTAQEISRLNLQSLRLTVLSACQTGTGTLREDGVFGVQRGFKKAGAHTLVMSLWSVSDEATKLMMTSFYRGLLGGLPRQEAFRQAQAAVRADERFAAPHFWAPFIMLDDI